MKDSFDAPPAESSQEMKLLPSFDGNELSDADHQQNATPDSPKLPAGSHAAQTKKGHHHSHRHSHSHRHAHRGRFSKKVADSVAAATQERNETSIGKVPPAAPASSSQGSLVGPEIIATDDAPVPFTQAAPLVEDDKKNKKTNIKPEIVSQGNDAPLPPEYYTSSYGVAGVAKKPAADNQRPEICLENNALVPPSCEISSTNIHSNKTRKKFAALQTLFHPSTANSEVNDSLIINRDIRRHATTAAASPLTSESVSPHEQSFNSSSVVLEIEATLVEDPEEYQPSSLIYDAVALQNDNQPLPWWKRHQQSILLGIVFVIFVIGALVGIVVSMASSQKSVNDKDKPFNNEIGNAVPSPSLPTASPITSAPKNTSTLTGAPMIPTTCDSYRVVFEGIVFESDTGDGCFAVLDGDAAAVATDHVIHFLSNVNGKYENMTTFKLDSSMICSIAISGDVAVAGTGCENSFSGVVYVFEKNSLGEWVQVVKIEPPSNISNGSFFGQSVGICGDVMLIGASDDGEGNEGSVFVYRRVNDTWVQEEKLAPNDSKLEEFGIIMSVKGNLLAVADVMYGDDDEGAVFVYGFDASSKSWKQLNGPLTNGDCGDLFGASVVLTDNKDLLIGCPYDNRITGAVYYYSLSSTGDRYVLQQKITASDGAPGDWFGTIYQMAVDGDAMLVSSEDKAYVFIQDNNVWTEVAKIDAPTQDSYWFGALVAMSGRKILINSFTTVYSYLLEEC